MQGQESEDAAVSAILLAFPGAEVIPSVGITPWPPQGYEIVEHPGGYRTARRIGVERPVPVVVATALCGKCGGGLGPDATDVCLEYYAAGTDKRLQRWTAGTVCRSCADARALEHGPQLVQAQEQALW